MKHKLSVVVILLTAFVLLIRGIDKPFIGHHDWNGAFWGNVTRNYLEVLSQNTRLKLISEIPPERVKFYYFSHYTPFLPILFTVSAGFLGLHEYSLRLVTVLFSVLLILAIYGIGKQLYSRGVGLLGALLAMVTPMFLYFGKLPDHEPIITSLITMTFYAYLRMWESKKWYRIFLSLFTLALLESWSGFFLVPFILIHYWRRKKAGLRRLLPVLVIAFSVVFLHVTAMGIWGEQGALQNFIQAGRLRLNLDSGPTNIHQFDWEQFLITEARYGVIYYTRILLILSFFWGVRFVWRLIRKDKNIADEYLVILLLFAVSFLLAFRNLSYIHDYKLYLLLPFSTISAAVILMDVWVWLKRLTIKLGWRRWSQGGLGMILIGGVVLGVATERMEYLQTLLKTSFNAPGQQLGVIIHDLTAVDEAVLVDSKEFEGFFGIFVKYYSHRQVDYADLDLEEFQNNLSDYARRYRYLVLIDGRTRDRGLEKYLLARYQSTKAEEFNLIDLASFR